MADALNTRFTNIVCTTRSSADVDKPASRGFVNISQSRSVKVAKHGTIQYVRYDAPFLRYSLLW